MGAVGQPIFAPGGAVGTTQPAGAVCPFPLQVDILTDRSTSKTFLDANGNPDHAIITGYVVARFTNTATGESITRNTSGPALVVFHDDGSVSISGRGPGGSRCYQRTKAGRR